MMVSDLIEQLKTMPQDAEVITPGNHAGHTVFGVTEAVEVEPAVLSDGSSYPVVMLRSD